MRLAATGTDPDGRYPVNTGGGYVFGNRVFGNRVFGIQPKRVAGVTAATTRPASALALSALRTPPFATITNGLPAVSWTPLLDASAPAALLLLETLTDRGIAACVGSLAQRDRVRRGWPSRPLRVWVDVARHTDAQDVARTVLTDPTRGGR
jgi:hypothetical protein